MLFKLFRIHGFRIQFISAAHKSDRTGTSFNRRLIRQYKRLLASYWDLNGKARIFHEMNEVLIPEIYNTLMVSSTFIIDQLEPKHEFRQLKVLDIGCGGGITSESLAKLNFDVVGIDPNPDLIEVAQSHQKKNKSLINKSLCYHNCTVEDFIKTHREVFDIVILSGVLEHLPFWKKKTFLELCTAFCKTDGKIFITTYNDSLLMLRRAIELKIHDEFGGVRIRWLNGISARNLSELLRSCGCSVLIERGLDADLVNHKIIFSGEKPAWFLMYAVKRALLR